MDLIHPHAKQDVEDAVRDAAATGSRLLVIGGRTHIDRGNPTDVDAELWTTMLDEVVAYESAEMLAVVHAGMRVGDLQAVLAEGGQEWPVDAHPDATVGGVIAAGASSFRRLRLGHVRDTVVELELVRGDGRLVKSGARTVKNVTGYDLHRLATGSLGTLGVIVQVALKLRPLPQVRRTLTLAGRRPRAQPPAARVRAAPLGRHRGARTRTRVARGLGRRGRGADDRRANDRPRPCRRPPPAPFDPMAIEGATVVEAAVTPSRIEALVAGRSDWTALLGVGLVWFGLPDGAEPLDELRLRVAEAAGVAPVIRGVGGLGDGTVAAPIIHRRLKESFDPAGIMAPGRFWGGI